MKEQITFRKYITEKFRPAFDPTEDNLKAQLALKAMYDKSWPTEPETLPAIFTHLDACDADDHTKAEVLVMWIYFVNEHWKELNVDQIATIKQCVVPGISQMFLNPQEKQLVKETMSQILHIERQNFRTGDFAQGIAWREV